MTTLFAFEFLMIAVALWLIAWGVLHPKYPAPAPALPPLPPTVSRRDVTYINTERPWPALRKALDEGYIYAGYTRSDKGVGWITMRRDD